MSDLGTSDQQELAALVAKSGRRRRARSTTFLWVVVILLVGILIGVVLGVAATAYPGRAGSEAPANAMALTTTQGVTGFDGQMF